MSTRKTRKSLLGGLDMRKVRIRGTCLRWYPKGASDTLRWSVAAVAATILLTANPTNAFLLAKSRGNVPNFFSSSGLPRTVVRRYTMTDPDVIQRETTHHRPRHHRCREQTAMSVAALENLYVSSKQLEKFLTVDDAKDKPAGVSLPHRTRVPREKGRANKSFIKQSSSNRPAKFEMRNEANVTMPPSGEKRIDSTSAASANFTKLPSNVQSDVSIGKKKSRSSTMPGFGNRHLSGKEKAFDDGIRLLERRTGKNLSAVVNTSDARKRRKKDNGVAMYKQSASVPDSLVQFADEIHKVNRITPKEEIELGSKTQEAIRLQNLYDSLEDNLQRAPTDEEWCAAAGKINMEAISQAINDGVEAKNQLVESNLRMVQGVVNTYIRNGLGGQYNAGDLMQEGVLALIRAAEKFDPNRGFRFSTYSMYWIRSAVKRSHVFQSRIVNTPQRMHDNYKRISKVRGELSSSLGREPSKKEISDAIGMSELQIDRCLTAMAQRFTSLDATISNSMAPNKGDNNKNSIIEIVDNQEYDTIKGMFQKEDLIETLYRHLAPFEAELLLLRFGLVDERTADYGFTGPLTIAEVSRLVGLAPDMVRRKINRSLKRLKYSISSEWDNSEELS